MPLFGASRAKRALERADDCGGIAVGQVAITGLTVGPHLEQVGSLQWSVNCGSLLWTPDATRVASAIDKLRVLCLRLEFLLLHPPLPPIRVT